MSGLTVKDGVTEFGVTTLDGEQAVVSSRDVADVFDKRHSDVLRGIDNTLEDLEEEFTERNFALSRYKDKSGKKNREYLMTRDGFTLITMGFTGKKAMKFKVAYIKQFNRMEELIKNRHFTRLEYKPMTDAIKEYRQAQGKTPKWYHFSNEANMINRIVLGDTSKKYCEKHDVPQDELRDHLPEWQLEALMHLQRLNTDLLHAGLEYDDRKEIIQQRFDKMYNNIKLSA
ncbi:Rha family transcriptional regulator [Natroniella acetigena]|uniref:Rha family transcriptional regulator n=1 Tax=Natroniella acetigena TaxID=52004 RepID=UPI00200AE533|nr:Rha family transcriptional regulator [Natroniella acetigena]MCK8826365.1 Rha family transcriptional regulator [Natroniella acetigena]